MIIKEKINNKITNLVTTNLNTSPFVGNFFDNLDNLTTKCI
jgi:hypothetical protein